MHHRATRKLCSYAAALLCSAAASLAQPAPPEAAPLSSEGRADCAIFCDRSDALSLRTATKLADYLAEQTGGVAPPVLDGSKLSPADPHRTLIVLDGTPGQ